MKIINSAEVDGYKFVVGPDFFAVERNGEEVVVLSPEDAINVLDWSSIQIANNLGQRITAAYPPEPVVVGQVELKPNGQVDTMAERRFTGKIPAHMLEERREPSSHDDSGVQRIFEVGATDLGALKKASDAGKFAQP